MEQCWGRLNAKEALYCLRLLEGEGQNQLTVNLGHSGLGGTGEVLDLALIHAAARMRPSYPAALFSRRYVTEVRIPVPEHEPACSDDPEVFVVYKFDRGRIKAEAD